MSNPNYSLSEIEQTVQEQAAKLKADYRKAHTQRDAALADKEQPGIPGIAPKPRLSELQIRSIAIKNQGSRATTDNVPLEIVISGAAPSSGLESIHDDDYYQAFLILAQTFQNQPTPTEPPEGDSHV